jgi:hypothetical protein
LADLNNNALFAPFDFSILANDNTNGANDVTNSNDLISLNHD